MNHLIRPATLADAEWLAPRMRAEDVAEVRAVSGHSPLEALAESLKASSTCYTAEGRGGEIVAMFGAAPIVPGAGSVWLLGTDGLHERNRVRFLRQSAAYLDLLHADYPLLMNYVAASNTVHINWLRWLGASFIKLHPRFGLAGVPFYEFVHIKRSTNHV